MTMVNALICLLEAWQLTGRFPAVLMRSAWEASLFESKTDDHNLAILSPMITIGSLYFCDTAADYYVEYQGNTGFAWHG